MANSTELRKAVRRFIEWYDTAPEGDPEYSGKYAPCDRDDIHCDELATWIDDLERSLDEQLP